jgi:two-component system, OmpR family, response regulator
MPEKLKQRLLLLEDDLNLNETISDFLDDSGFDVHSVYSGEDAQNSIYENNFDLLVLDVNVPAPSGFELLAQARKEGNQTPAIFLTSLNGMDDVEKGFDVGCDDYIRKPFALKELLLRIQTILKRNFSHQESDRQTLTEALSYDINNQTLYLNDQAVSLHQKEQKLLQLFLQHKNEPLTHETIMSHLWTYDEEPSDLSLRTYIKNLRKILGKDSIESIKRYGYKFSLQRT